ncbi:prenyltransferase/squalene oxidase repeat-containing protein [Nocardioides daphniae]|uniref:Squalene cyclase C-terminal domain-containing protein n=1 Tax=Nocardioides daphniae TaxID=402297 RepID=A0A4P7U9P0_9ACTN|nr:prenyltransferase/squalene oxidase repeat-containing protein [Nocardioides daphniae]QCC76843.1 hypothetical protein E2C04_05730 [Nocardioides daphniae]GGD17030.1 hypothetical protein GCM10007231_15000 [Nocardioides daphniae]
MLRSTRTRAAFVAATALVVTGLGQVPAQAATDSSPAQLAGTWMTGNLNGDGLLTGAYADDKGETQTFTDYGSSVDLALSLDAVGGDAATVTRITDAIAAQVGDYTAPWGDVYAGSSAKAMTLAVSQGRDPRTFGGRDLQAQVEGRVITTGASTGRIEDLSAWGDYANSIGQAFAARALTAAGSSLADEATDYLLLQQCDAGFFRLDFTKDKAAADQTCDGASGAVDADGPDVTALVALQLAAIESPDADVTAALADAKTWLAAQQAADGGFGSTDNGANANSTGLGGWALAELGDTARATKAATWLRARQVVGACDGKLAPETGAIAYSDEALAAGRKDGIADPLDRVQWIIAGAQGLAGLASAPATSAKDKVTAPRFAKAGSKVTFTVTGLAAGERGCLSGAVGTRTLVGTGSALKAVATLKAGTRSVTLRTATATGTSSVTGTVTVLGKKKLKVSLAKKQVKRNAKVKVTVKGLARGERVTVKVRGKKVATGTANAKGVLVRTVKVGKARGVARVAVQGQYATRTGTAKIRVR